ncbi:hypothetical protein KUD11_03255 [Roseovarius sp. LXJ103]|uniref:hypothetical protein n=1 Tax=Roseovarius carneus TaxID=2853164 RepID=UPI0011B27046|nr:hypothetical protein [Roseovarius carneus]MBZ8117660.1 hypothetical protein [Roseovarius carneus]
MADFERAGMSFRKPHELHGRRFGRNLGLGVVLAGSVALIFGLTIAKVSDDSFVVPTQVEGGY